MNQRKTNCRSERTKQKIKTSFMELLSEKDSSLITVKEISAMAKINRVTFYDHYENTQSLYLEIEDDIFKHFKQSLTDDRIISYEDFYGFIVDYLLEDRNIGRMILKSTDFNGKLLANIRDFFVEGCYETWRDERGITKPDDKLKLIAHYRVQGAIGLLLEWIISNYSLSADGVKHLLSNLDNMADDYKY